jgi:hypothetical protein
MGVVFRYQWTKEMKLHSMTSGGYLDGRALNSVRLTRVGVVVLDSMAAMALSNSDRVSALTFLIVAR